MKITNERGEHLKKELIELKEEYDSTGEEISRLNIERSSRLSYIKKIDSLEKFKDVQQKITNEKAELISLKDKVKKLEEYNKKQKKLEEIKRRKNEVIDIIEKNIKSQIDTPNSIYNQIKLKFDNIIETIINKHALIKTKHNKEGNIEFSTELLDSSGNSTSESEGHTYRKFLCMPFDIAINLVYLKDNFPHFIFHDGIFDNMDIRKKKNFVELSKQIADLGVQYIITYIDSDFPDDVEESDYFVPEDYIVELDDSGNKGKLFKMPSW